MSIVVIQSRLRELADIIRNNVNAREAIAEGFELMAQAMEPCEDCGSRQGAAPAPGADSTASTDTADASDINAGV